MWQSMLASIGANVGSNLLNKFLGGGPDEKLQRYQIEERALDRRERNYWNNRSFAFADTAARNTIQWRVEDAKRAGIHPMFAMGQPGVGSPSFTAGGGGGALGFDHETGSALGTGLDVVGMLEASRQAERQGRMDKFRQRLMEAQIKKAEADTSVAMANASRIKRAEQNMNNTRALPPEDGVVIRKLPKEQVRGETPWERVEPHERAPLYRTLTQPGRGSIITLSEQAGDELSQGYTAYQLVEQWLHDKRNRRWVAEQVRAVQRRLNREAKRHIPKDKWMKPYPGE